MAEATRYFPGHFPVLRHRLDTYLAALGERLAKTDFAPDVAFLLLAGGYGRGEGGIFETENAPPALYNDLEFYLALKSPGAAQPAAAWCREQSHAGEHETGIEVEFKVLPLQSLSAAEPSMFYYDLLAAHRLVYGDPALVAALPARLRDPALIPAHEATRLLFNRGTGLLYASALLEASGAALDTAFIERNHAKAKLAFADAVLTLNGQYTWSCAARHARLAGPLPQSPANLSQLIEWHAAAVDFKFHPRHASPPPGTLPDTLLAQHRALVSAWRDLFLWLESIRLGREFRTPSDYALQKARLLPEFPPLRNFALHLRDRLRRGAPPRGWFAWFDYPRAPLQRVLMLLLADGDKTALHESARILSLPPASNAQAILEKYRYWWGWYN